MLKIFSLNAASSFLSRPSDNGADEQEDQLVQAAEILCGNTSGRWFRP